MIGYLILIAAVILFACIYHSYRKSRMAARVTERAAAVIKPADAYWKRSPPTMPPRQPRPIATMPYGEGPRLSMNNTVAMMVERQDIERMLIEGDAIPATTMKRLGLLSDDVFYIADSDTYRMTMRAIALKRADAAIVGSKAREACARIDAEMMRRSAVDGLINGDKLQFQRGRGDDERRFSVYRMQMTDTAVVTQPDSCPAPRDDVDASPPPPPCDPAPSIDVPSGDW